MSKQFANKPIYLRKPIKVKAGTQLNKQDIRSALEQHLACNWGDISGDEWLRNDEAYKSGGRVISRHTTAKGKPFWLISETSSILITDDRKTERAKRAC